MAVYDLYGNDLTPVETEALRAHGVCEFADGDVTMAMHSGVDYRFMGELTSLTLTSALEITSHPQDFSGVLGSAALFHVGTVGADLTYMWQSNMFGEWRDTSFSTSETDTLSLTVTEERDGVKYRCVVTDTHGGQAISRSAALHMSETGSVKLRILSHPQDYIGPRNTEALFSVVAEGENRTYMWQALTNGTWSDTSFTTSRQRVVRIPITEARSGRLYRCVVTDGEGNQAITMPARLMIGEHAGLPAVDNAFEPLHYHVSFQTPSETVPAGFLTLPPGTVLPDGFELLPDNRYELDILDGYCVAANWAVSS